MDNARRDFMVSINTNYSNQCESVGIQIKEDTMLCYLGAEVDIAYKGKYPYSSRHGNASFTKDCTWSDFPDYGTDDTDVMREKLWSKYIYDTSLSYADKEYLAELGYLHDHWDFSFFRPIAVTDTEGKRQRYRVISIAAKVDGLPPRALAFNMKDSRDIDISGDIRPHLREIILTKYLGTHAGSWIPDQYILSTQKLDLDDEPTYNTESPKQTHKESQQEPRQVTEETTIKQNEYHTYDTDSVATIQYACQPSPDWLSVLAYELASAFTVDDAQIVKDIPKQPISLTKFREIIKHYKSKHQSVVVKDNKIIISLRNDPDLLFIGGVHVVTTTITLLNENRISLTISGNLIHGVHQILAKLLEAAILGKNSEVGFGFANSNWPLMPWRSRH